MEDSIVKVEHLSHRYHIQWAIQDINFEIKKGVWPISVPMGRKIPPLFNEHHLWRAKPNRGGVYLNGCNLRQPPVEAKRHIGFSPKAAAATLS